MVSSTLRPTVPTLYLLVIRLFLTTDFLHQECSTPNRTNFFLILPSPEVRVTSRLLSASRSSSKAINTRYSARHHGQPHLPAYTGAPCHHPQFFRIQNRYPTTQRRSLRMRCRLWASRHRRHLALLAMPPVLTLSLPFREPVVKAVLACHLSLVTQCVSFYPHHLRPLICDLLYSSDPLRIRGIRVISPPMVARLRSKMPTALFIRLPLSSRMFLLNRS